MSRLHFNGTRRSIGDVQIEGCDLTVIALHVASSDGQREEMAHRAPSFQLQCQWQHSVRKVLQPGRDTQFADSVTQGLAS